MKSFELHTFIQLTEQVLTKEIDIQSVDPSDPIQVHHVPQEWTCIGTGNYAAVFSHSSYPNWVVKVYARERKGVKIEADIYRQLGSHPSFSHLVYEGSHFLILKRIEGITLYQALHKGVRIPPQVIKDIQTALNFARKKGLNPYDCHAKNLIMNGEKGFVIDVSDFRKKGSDPKWKDLERFYFHIYVHTIYKFPIPIPHYILNIIRHLYRRYRKLS